MPACEWSPRPSLRWGFRSELCTAGAPRKRRRGSGGLSQPSFTREKTNQASTANPKRRRKGFTPRSSSSAAHSARAAEARTTRTSCTQNWGCTSHITPDASNHSVSDQLGCWASVTRPVVSAAEHPVQEARAVLCHLRRSQRRTPAGRCPGGLCISDRAGQRSSPLRLVCATGAPSC
jgi:hypothetical protein